MEILKFDSEEEQYKRLVFTLHDELIVYKMFTTFVGEKSQYILYFTENNSVRTRDFYSNHEFDKDILYSFIINDIMYVPSITGNCRLNETR